MIAPEERTTDVPEFADLNQAFPEEDWDERARGLGASLWRPVTMTSAATDPDEYWAEGVRLWVEDCALRRGPALEHPARGGAQRVPLAAQRRRGRVPGRLPNGGRAHQGDRGVGCPPELNLWHKAPESRG